MTMTLALGTSTPTSMTVVDTSASVSYTHLDVYKRQDLPLFQFGGQICIFGFELIFALLERKDDLDQFSAAHMPQFTDVYKRQRLSGVKGGRFAQACAPAQVFSIVLSDILGDPLDMIAQNVAEDDAEHLCRGASLRCV